MAPCSDSGCDYCATGIGTQVRYCFAAVEPTSRRVGLIETGKGNGQQIQDWAQRNGGLPGMVLEFSKHTKNPQSRTDIRYIDIPVEFPWRMCEVPDIFLALYLTWNKAGHRIPQELKAMALEKLRERDDRLRHARAVEESKR
jgi:hypothetical protein